MPSLVLVALFLAALQMFSLDIAGNGISANYVYVLFPFIFKLVGPARRLVRRDELFLVLFIYTAIYLLGVPVDIVGSSSGPGNALRRLFSYLVFLCPFFLSLIQFKPNDIRLFKKAIVLSSLLYSLKSILAVSSLSGSVGVFDLKPLVGSQRYGFILCLGFFIALLDNELLLKKWTYLQRLLACSLILAGMALTFSRATAVSLAAGLVFLAGSALVNKCFSRKTRSTKRVAAGKLKLIPMMTVLLLAACGYAVFQAKYGVDSWAFYSSRFIDPLLDSTLLTDTLTADPDSSEGYRYYMAVRIAGYLKTHPIIGSSYRGIYLVFDEFKDGGSTHNQYADVFLRTGLCGGLLWLYLLYRITRFCAHDRGLLVGLVSIIVYGLFHETFKESYGSFVFGMLLSCSYLKESSVLRKRRETSSHGTGQLSGRLCPEVTYESGGR